MKWRESGNRIAPSCRVRSHGVMNGRFAPSCSTEMTKSRSEVMVGRKRTGNALMEETAAGRSSRSTPSHIHLDLVAVQLHQVAARLRLALAHQLGQGHGGFGEPERT